MPPIRRLVAHPAAGIAVLIFVILMAGSGGYGYHRDELYFLAAGDHLAAGYPDQGPMTPLIAGAMDTLAPDSLTVLRLPSALAIGALVLVTGLLAAELGAGRRGQAIATGCAAVGAVFMFTGHLLSTTTFDLLAWTVLTYIVVRAVRRGQDRLWLPAGFVCGLALLNKPLVAFLLGGMLAGVLISGPRSLLRSPWVWAGAATAVLMWSPWLIWQAGRGWPQFEVAGNIAAGGSTSSESRWAFLPFQLLLVSPFLAPVWIAGLVRILRDRALRPLRFLGWTWIVLAATFIALGGKPYFIAGLLPLMLAAGAAPVDRWLDRGRARVRQVALAVAIGVSAVVAAVVSLPLLPTDRLDPIIAVNEDVGNTIGWPEFARTVAGVRDATRGGDHAIIFTANYGEAGAIDRYGPDLGLPRAYSGHNGYADWGVPPDSDVPVIAIGFGRGRLRRSFSDCSMRARIDVEGGLETEEDGSRVWVCREVRAEWSELWPKLRVLG
ncbi:MAG TPA: glycosyltransferase family 39 protein [Solirubrobacterales bacterium]|nr:glycosyltransferase family 39 protein [Solirubrobacterales bacterium]